MAEPIDQPIWNKSDWLGWYIGYHQEVYLPEHGWWHWSGEIIEDFFFYDYDLELWGWVSDASYPWIYWCTPVETWAYYSRDGGPGDRWFYFPKANEWLHQETIREIYQPHLLGMVLIPSGEFVMGDSYEEGNDRELPVHTVYLGDFLLQKTEVTIEQWDRAVTWSKSKGYDLEHYYSSKITGSNHAVNGVSWYEAVKFCNAMSEMAGLYPVYTVGGGVYRSGRENPDIDYTVNGYRLPTEAEWEKAARGKLSGKRFPWGDEIDHDRAIYRANSTLYFYDVSGHAEDTSHPVWGYWTGAVGSLPRNGYGLYDMAGNVYEFCNDYFQSDYYSVSPAVNPRGPVSGTSRVFRGGSFLQWAVSCRVSDRTGTTPEYDDYQFGFRLARSKEE